MNEQKEEPKQNDLITIAGGVELEVTHLDGSKEAVKIRQIPVTKLEQFVQRLSDEATSISIYCDKPREWADSLELASANAICEKGMDINGPFLQAWFRRQANWRDMTYAGAIAELQKKVESMVEALRSGNFAPQSPTITSSPPNK